jgi:hypothetical protein
VEDQRDTKKVLWPGGRGLEVVMMC